jgi:hypothetical protein
MNSSKMEHVAFSVVIKYIYCYFYFYIVGAAAAITLLTVCLPTDDSHVLPLGQT